MAHLGVNIDHVATVRQARRTYEPDPVWAASLAELGGADGITIHLRETVTVKLNLELGASDEIVGIACHTKPEQATLVPENRQEITTEGGLDVIGQRDRVVKAIKRLKDAGIVVSLFLDPDLKQIEAAAELGVEAVELHTGTYAEAKLGKPQQAELVKLTTAGRAVRQAGMVLHAGHGLTYRNVQPVARIAEMSELNIGHSIVARAVMVGMQRAVREMKELIKSD